MSTVPTFNCANCGGLSKRCCGASATECRTCAFLRRQMAYFQRHYNAYLEAQQKLETLAKLAQARNHPTESTDS